jgi:hypothetical protein
MDKIRVTPTTWRRLQQNAEEYATEMAAIATPEQIERVRRQNDLFDRGIEICPNCSRESMRKSETCEYCSQDKLPF